MASVTRDSLGVGLLTEQLGRSAAVAAAKACGLDPDPVSLVRMGSRAVFRLAGNRVLARVALYEHRNNALREVEVAVWLRSAGVPVDQPWDSQLYEEDGLVVTLWKARDGDWASTGELAGALKMLHAVPAETGPSLPRWDPFPEMRSRIARAGALEGVERLKLAELVDASERQLRHASFPLPTGVINGDASVGNILRMRTGELVLFDLEGVSTGPAEWDLVITSVYRELGWHTDDEYRNFVRAYGFDVSEWGGYRALANAQKLRMICWLAGKAAGDTEATVVELRRRIESLDHGDGTYVWQPL